MTPFQLNCACPEPVSLCQLKAEVNRILQFLLSCPKKEQGKLTEDNDEYLPSVTYLSTGSMGNIGIYF